MSHDFDNLMDEAIDNIRNDRTLAREFQNEIATQLVKVLTLKQKERSKEVGLSEEDKASLFDMIQGES